MPATVPNDEAELAARVQFHRANALAADERLASIPDDRAASRQICALWYIGALDEGSTLQVMLTKKKPRAKLAPLAASVIRPVASRLNRIEDLLIEVRGVLDLQLKRTAALQREVDMLAEKQRVRLPA